MTYRNQVFNVFITIVIRTCILVENNSFRKKKKRSEKMPNSLTPLRLELEQLYSRTDLDVNHSLKLDWYRNVRWS